MIRFVPRDELDKKKWDTVIHFSRKGFPYAYTWYLDAVAEFWDALVYDDYAAVMPVCWNKKYGFEYVYQPHFTQQLGVFSTHSINQELVQEFIDAIPDRFRLVEMNLNIHNQFDLNGFEQKEMVSMYLEMIELYEEIRKGYNENTKRNLKKADGLTLVDYMQPEELMALFLNTKDARHKLIPKKFNHRLVRLMYDSMHHNSGKIMGVSDESNSLIAGGFFLKSSTNLINLFPVVSEKGKERRAMFFLLDQIVQKNAGKPMTLDFEGSNVESVARFYGGFGAEKKHYPFIKRNKLPWPVNMLK